MPQARIPPVGRENANDYHNRETLEAVPVLMVDDREENHVALEVVLRNPGYQLIRANSGDDALRYLLDQIPAVILMDVQMPGLDGYETATIIKSNPRTRDIPIIFITAINTDERFLHRGYEHGAIDYIYKPFDPYVLRSKVAVLTDLFRKTERLLRAERALRESEALERERKIADLELRSLRREQIEQKRYRSLVEGIDHGFVWSANPESMALTFVSPAAVKLTGYSPEDWLSDPNFFLKRLNLEDQPAFQASLERAIATGAEIQVEHRIQLATGQSAWFQTGMRVVAGGEGARSELRGLSVDISKLKNAEHTLAQAKLRSDVLGQTSFLLTKSIQNSNPFSELVVYLQSKVCDFCFIESSDILGHSLSFASGDQKLDSQIEKHFKANSAELSEEDRSRWATGQSELSENPDREILKKIFGNSERVSALVKLPIKAVIQVGLALNGNFLGLLTLGYYKESALQESQTSMAEDVGYRISSVLENSVLLRKAESAIRLRDEFLSIASHELRTPLTPLKIRVQQIERILGKLDSKSLPIEQLTKSVKTCHHQIERLSKLVDDLLDISRISRGKLSLHPERFNLPELIRDIVSRFSGQLEAAGCTLSLKLEENLDVSLDLSRIEQVIVNLLTNAIKYAPGLPIEIEAKALKGGELELSVRDHGMGIAPEDQARIFERFERAVSSNHFGGLGLGLYIVSQILNAHGGQICVDSQLGKGSSFVVRLPKQVEATREVAV